MGGSGRGKPSCWTCKSAGGGGVRTIRSEVENVSLPLCGALRVRRWPPSPRGRIFLSSFKHRCSNGGWRFMDFRISLKKPSLAAARYAHTSSSRGRFEDGPWGALFLAEADRPARAVSPRNSDGEASGLRPSTTRVMGMYVSLLCKSKPDAPVRARHPVGRPGFEEAGCCTSCLERRLGGSPSGDCFIEEAHSLGYRAVLG